MPTQNRATLKSYFQTGDRPTQQQFANLIDSMALTSEVSSAGNIFSYPKHESVTEDDIGKLMMVDFHFLVDNPNGPEDLTVTARVANTQEGVAGTKGTYLLKFPKNPMIEPKREKRRIVIASRPVNGETLTIGHSLSGGGSVGFSIAFYDDGINSSGQVNTVNTNTFADILDQLKYVIENQSLGIVTNLDYKYSNQANHRGIKQITGSGLNDVSLQVSGGALSLYAVDVKIEILANGYVYLPKSDEYGPDFQIGEIITGGTSGATGKVIEQYDNSPYYVKVYNVTGTFEDGETITGGTSGVSYTINGTPSSFSDDIIRRTITDGLGNNQSEDFILITSGITTGIGTIYFDSASGHTIGDKWQVHADVGGVKYPISGLSGGDFQLGETITGDTSEATGIVRKIESGFLYLSNIVASGTPGNVFSVTETVTGNTSGATATLGVYSDELFFGDPSMDVEFLLGSAMATEGSFYTDTVFTPSNTARIQDTVLQAHTTELDFQIATAARNNSYSNSALISGSSWDTHNSNTNLIRYRDLFFNNNFGAFGTSDQFNMMKFFADTSEWMDAIDWALDESSDNSTSGFQYMFDKVGSPTMDSTYILFTVENKTAPSGDNNVSIQYYKGYGDFWDLFVSVQSVAPVTTIYEHVANTVLGVLKGIEGENVLIDGGYTLQVKLAETGDGGMFSAPWSEQINVWPYLIAWRDGTVIDIFGLITLLGESITQSNYFSIASGTGAIFTSFSLGIAGDVITVTRAMLLFGGN
jgi:hypothetical protein